MTKGNSRIPSQRRVSDGLDRFIIGGVLVAYGSLGRGDDSFDWTAFFVSTLIAAVLVVIAAAVTGRDKKTSA